MRLWWLIIFALGARGAELHYDLLLKVEATGWIQGSQTVSGVAEGDWQEAVFRLYPAALGQELLSPLPEPGWDQVHPTALVVPLGCEAGQTFSVHIAFQGQLPSFERQGGYGLFARSEAAMVLAQCYPMLAPWQGGWLVEPVFPWGDGVVAEVADYRAEVWLPPGWKLVAGGEESHMEAGGYLVAGESLRELGMVALDGYVESTETVAGVRVRSFYLPEHAEAGEAALKITCEALALYVELFGPYPWEGLDVVQVPLSGAAGVEFPGLVLAGQDYYARYPQDPLFFPMIFAHEVAHQWWYAQVGSDQVAEPWLDEALATYTSGLFFESQGRLAEIISYWESSYLQGRGRNPQARVSSPLWEFPDGAGYGGMVYSGGALFLHELRGRMGDEAFFRALRRYLAEYRWKIARGEDFLRVLRAESPLPLENLILSWLGPTDPH